MEMQESDEGPATAKNNTNDFEPCLLSPSSMIIHCCSDTKYPEIHLTPTVFDLASSTKLEDPSADPSGVQPSMSFDGAMLHPPAQPTRMISLKARSLLSSTTASQQSICQGFNCRYARMASISYHPPSPLPPPQLPLPPLPPPSSPPL
ncbi:hypothetical protein M422DRAFT_270735 [Sphaerobolus stellatus SS14]|uniref:Uncharacterized protein n=1 Tax=Sphaerobolus stellatus (strain SS14) TaxID=990650 RepID=A0A0C9URQ7_SPHS4|nr:hypothetical protein M422DRAFT_270735 [Sphaerobolus stellatus SS14]